MMWLWVYLAGLVIAPVPLANSALRLIVGDDQPDTIDRVGAGFAGVLAAGMWPALLAIATIYGVSRLAWSVLPCGDGELAKTHRR